MQNPFLPQFDLQIYAFYSISEITVRKKYFLFTDSYRILQHPTNSYRFLLIIRLLSNIITNNKRKTSRYTSNMSESQTEREDIRQSSHTSVRH